MVSSLLRPEPAPLLAPGETVVLFDGVCKLCNGWAQFVIRHDRGQRIRLATVQSAEGQALLAWAGLPLDRFDTMATIRDRHYWVRSAAFFEVVRQLPGLWPCLGVLRVVPERLRDLGYDWVARNRYRWFGRHAQCLMPTADHQRRFLHSDVPR